MKVPKGYTEQEVVDIIEKVSSRLAGKFKFGYHGIEDMKQQAAMIALESLDKYDETRPLENFLYVCVHNGLFNEKRNKFERPDKPCFTCPFYDKHCLKSSNQCAEFNDRMDCKLYNNWSIRNGAKKNIMKPIDIYNVRDEREQNMRVDDHVDDIVQKELWNIIDKHLDIGLRADYIKIKNNVKLPKKRRVIVEQAIFDIMREHYDK